MHVGTLAHREVCVCRVMCACSHTSTLKPPRRHVWEETLVLITSSPSVFNIPLRMFKVLSVPPAATCTFHCLVWWQMKHRKQRFLVHDEIQLMKRGKYAISNVSHSLYAQLTTADVTFPHNGSAYLLVLCCIWASASFRVMRWHRCGRKGQGKKRDFGELRAERGKGQKHRDEKWWRRKMSSSLPNIKGHFPLTTGSGIIWNKHGLLGNCTAAMHCPLYFRGCVALQEIKCCLSRVTLWPHGCWQAVNMSWGRSSSNPS